MVLTRVISRYLHNHIYKMNRAYLRHLTDSDRFELTFQYVDPLARIDRQFNFCRQNSESVTNFSQRVATNIEKAFKKKAKNQNNTIQVGLKVNGNLVSDETTLCREVFDSSTNNEVTLNVCDQEYKVIINSPWVSGIALPTSILAGFPVYPAKLETVYTDRLLSDLNWYKSPDKNNWVSVGTGFIYNTINSDIGNFLKLSCLPRNGDVEGPVAEAISTVQVQAGPGFCPFETRHQFTRERCEGKRFRVVTYNILADLYCDMEFTRTQLHPYCPPYALEIDYRKQLFIKEITGYNADIICLQEVDKKVYNYDLQPVFREFNYDSNFCVKGASVVEGEACFFNRNRFKEVETFRVVLSDELNTNPLFGDIRKVIEGNKQLSERFSTRSTVLQVVVLESLDNEEVLVIGNTHLYFHPDADHIRLLQGAMIIRYLEHVVNEFKAKMQKRVSLVICGDFNSGPEFGILQLYTTGRVEEDHMDFQSKPEEAVKISLSQPFLLKSACGTPPHTNFTSLFTGCLDYIYYESQNFEVAQVVPLPSLEELTQNTALPSIVFPSDHIALVSDLEWTHSS